MYLGLDFGTSGARACVIDAHRVVHWKQHFTYPEAASQTPFDWRNALYTLLDSLPKPIAQALQGIAIDGTSGTVMLCDLTLTPIGPALLYNDARATLQAQQLKLLAPTESGVCSPTSGLAKLLWLAQHHPNASYMLHQADWLTALLSGQAGSSDYHNALKSGYDAERLEWPDWVQSLPVAHLLPQVVSPGEVISRIASPVASRFGIAMDCVIHAGTTDSIAAFMASDVNDTGIGVTSLGTTLVLKQLSKTRIDAPDYGIYSHRFGKLWLVGGASNAGAGILRKFFDDGQLCRLSTQIDATQDSPLDYYPLVAAGERFPTNDPSLLPRLSPRPTDDVAFLHGLLQGLARIEATGYARLAELGADPVSKIFSNGGGAQNPAWCSIRSRLLNRPVFVCAQNEAAYGAALLASRHDVLATADE